MWVSDMIIRKGKKADFKAIAKLWLSFFTDTPDVPDAYSARHAKRGELLVAVEGNNVIGFLEFSKNHFFESDYIEAVIVNEQFRGKGVAASLLQECERQAKERGCRRIFSSVEPWNAAALQMHQRLGYKKCGYVDHIWGEGKRDLFFSKKL